MEDNGFYHKENGLENASSEELRDSEHNFTSNTEQTDAPSGALNKEGLYRAEGGAGFTSGVAMGVAGLTPWGRAYRFAKTHKKLVGIGGGGFIGFIIAIVIFFGFLAAYELVTIEKDMLRYEEKGVAYVIKKASNSIMKRMYCRGMSGATAASLGCSSENNTEGSKAVEDKTDPMTAEIDTMKFTDPQVQKALLDQGIQVEDSGNQLRFKDLTTGNYINYDQLDQTDMQLRFQKAIPSFDIGQIKAYRPLLTVDEGADWNPIPAPEESSPDKDVAEDINGTAENEGQQLKAAEVEDGKSPTNEPKSQVANDTLAAATEGTVLETADQAIAAGDSEAVVISKAEAAAAPHLGAALTIGSIVATLCSIDRVATKVSEYRIPTILAFLVRHSSTLLGIADEMKVGGTMTGKQISGFTKLFNGNQSIKPTKTYDPTLSDAAMPFSRSAAWQRIEGNPVNTNRKSSGYNPDFSSSLLPTKNAGTSVVNSINRILDFIGGGALCSLVNNSVFGHIFTVIGWAATAGIDFSSIGVGEVAIMGAVTSFQLATKHIIIPQIVKYFTPVGMNGLENSVQWMNNADAGTNISMNMYMQRLGGEPMSPTQTAELNAKGAQLETIAESHKSFLTRTFSFSDPSSLVSRVAVDLPLSRLGIINSFFSDIISAPELLFRAFSDLIGGARVFASQSTNPGATYGLTQYGFSTSEITRYDPINNENYLIHAVVPFHQNTKTLIQLLGNPSNFPNGSYDSNPNDLLHCFAQDPYGPNGQLTSSFLWAQQSDQAPVSPICGTMGNMSADTPPVGISSPNVAQYVVCPGMGYGTLDKRCNNFVTKFLRKHDVINRFRQYILDDQVTNYIYDYQSTVS